MMSIPLRSVVLAAAATLSTLLPPAAVVADQPYFLTAEPGGRRVRKHATDGTLIRTLIAGDQTFRPNHFCIDGERTRLFVPTYAGTRSVLVFDLDDGTPLGEIDHPNFVSPAWTGLAPNGDLIIADFDGARVYRYDLDADAFVGELVAPGHLLTAHSVVFNDDGTILVLDWAGGRIVRYLADGSFDLVLHDGPALLGPLDMLPSPDGTELYVTNAALGNVARFDRQTGAALGELIPATPPLIASPEGMFFDRDGSLLVTSPGTNRILRFDAHTGAPLGALTVSTGYPVDLLLVPARCPADIDDDGVVNFPDLLGVLASWGPCPAPCPGDPDGSGSVDLTDVLTVLAAWGPCAP